MPIKPVNDPPAARSLAKSYLAARNPPGGGAALTALFTGPPQLGALGVYNISLEKLVGGELEAAVQTGWRYVRLRPGANAGQIVEIDMDRDRPDVASFASGKLASSIGKAAAAVERRVAKEDAEFEPRVLRLPEIQMEALWVHHDDPSILDRFQGLPSSQQDLADQDFLEAAKERARRYLETVRASRSGIATIK